MLLETGGGLRNVREWMGEENVRVHNGDIFSTMPLEQLVEAYERSGLPVTLALRSEATAKHIACAGGRVIDIRNRLGKAEGTPVFTGVYCMNAALFDVLPEETVVSVIFLLVRTTLRLRSLPLPAPPLRPPQQKSLSKQHQISIKQPGIWCHKTWRNDFTSSVSFFIGATRLSGRRGWVCLWRGGE